MAKQLGYYAFITLLNLLLLSASIHANSTDIFGPSSAVTSRYWDCCKPSCSWSNKASVQNNQPALSCNIHDQPLFDATQGTGCIGGTSFGCANNSPWAVNDTFSYGFAAAFTLGGDESTWCCGCYQLTFTSGSVKGKSMIVQAINTDYDSVDDNTFALAVPGGNTSYAGACAIQYGVPNATFGANNVGVATRADCDNLPAALKAGCYWRFDWYENALQPSVDYSRVSCPAALTNISDCVRTDDTTFEATANKTASSAATSLPLVSSSSIFALFVFWVSQINA